MDTKSLVDQWVELDKQAKDIKRRQDVIVKALGQQTAGTELQGHKHRIRVKDRTVLNAELLEQAVSPNMWRRITKRVPVAALYRAELERGKLSKDTLATCSTRSTSWFETV